MQSQSWKSIILSIANLERHVSRKTSHSGRLGVNKSRLWIFYLTLKRLVIMPGNKLLFISLFSLFASLNNGNCQKALSKEEIRMTWVKDFSRSRPDSQALSLGEDLDNKIKILIDSLQQNNLDTIGFFARSYPGLNVSNRCRTGYYPTDIYFFWKEKGRTFEKMLQNHCESPITEKETSFFEYYEGNSAAIKNYQIMPVILEGYISVDNKFQMVGKAVFHEIKYAIYCKLKNAVFASEFGETDLQDEESLFFTDNLNSKEFQWFQQINAEVGKPY